VKCDMRRNIRRTHKDNGNTKRRVLSRSETVRVLQDVLQRLRTVGVAGVLRLSHRWVTSLDGQMRLKEGEC